MEYVVAHLRADEAELRRGAYACDPALCKGRVCCAVFDVAVTHEEQARLRTLLPRVAAFCPWLTEGEDPFLLTPWEIFIRKRRDGLCWFNFVDEQGRAWCGVHAAALAAGENPYAWKPLNCALWPFLRDGSGRLTLDDDTSFPCLRHTPASPEHVPQHLVLATPGAAGAPDSVCEPAVIDANRAVGAESELLALLQQLAQALDVPLRMEQSPANGEAGGAAAEGDRHAPC